MPMRSIYPYKGQRRSHCPLPTAQSRSRRQAAGNPELACFIMQRRKEERYSIMTSGQFKAFIGSVLPILLIGSLHTDTSLAADRPDFSGTWQLNEELSEDPRGQMKKKTGDRGGRGGGRGGMREGGNRGTGGQGRDPGGMQERLQSMKERIETLDIQHQDPELAIGFGDGTQRTLFTDGRKMEDNLESGVFEAKAKWKASSSVLFKAENAVGQKITETYELDASGQRLEVTTRIEGGDRRPDMSFKRVYDRALVAPESTDSDEIGT